MPPTLHNLQALRGVACLMVFGVHLAVWENTFGIARPLLKPLYWFGYAGVDLFFVLSGFLITFTQHRHLGRPRDLPAYLFRRAWRIYPLFWVVMAVGVAVMLGISGVWAVPTQPDAPGPRTRWVSWLLLAPCAVVNQYVPPAWSLAHEMLFYLAFAGLIVLPRRVGPWLLVLWGCAVGVTEWYGGVHTLTANAWLRHLASPFVWEFLLGCGVAWLAVRGATRFGRTAVLFGLAWGVGWVWAYADPSKPADAGSHPAWRAWVFGIASALLVYGAVAVERRGGWLLPRWLRRVGDASYSIYLWHAPAGALAFSQTLTWPHTFWPHLAWLLGMTLVCVGGGLVLSWIIEQPLLRLGKGRKPKVEPMEVLACRVEIVGAGRLTPNDGRVPSSA